MKTILIASTLLTGALLLYSCSDYLDINEKNPNQATSSTAELVLSNALNTTASRLGHNEIGSFWTGILAPSGSVSGFDGERTYNITSTFRTAVWTGPFNNLADYKYVEQVAKQEGKFSIAGIARLMKAFNFQIIVDAYGNAPYSQALQGTSEIRPAHDEASAIYDSLLIDIDKAKLLLSVPVSGSNPSAGAADIYFGGDTDLWLKFANTLKLRMLLRISNVTNVASQISILASDSSGFLGEDEDVQAQPGYLRSAGKMNPFYETYGYTSGNARSNNHDFYAINDFLISNLVTNNDPRLTRIAYPATSDNVTYKGVPLGGQSDEFLFSKISGIGPAFLPQDNNAGTSLLFERPQVVMSVSESYFLQAEAIERGFYTGNAQALYEAGITESFFYMGVPDYEQAALTYYSQNINTVNWGTSADKLEAISTQKWLALSVINGFEAWCEYRRTGFPNVPLSIRAQGTQQPVRLIYPQSEYSNNSANANAQGTINQYTSKIFWMN